MNHFVGCLGDKITFRSTSSIFHNEI